MTAPPARFLLALTLGLLPASVALAQPAAPRPSDRSKPARPEPEVSIDIPLGGPLDDDAIVSGLAWLVRQQRPDGGWAAEGRDEATATGFAVLALLGAGQGPGPAHAHVGRQARGEYVKAAEAGLRFLRGRQRPDGRLSADPIGHAVATAALCQATAVDREAQLRSAAAKALEAIVAAQLRSGGWAARPEADADLAASAWHLLALRLGLTSRLMVPAEAMARAGRYLDAAPAMSARPALLLARLCQSGKPDAAAVVKGRLELEKSLRERADLRAEELCFVAHALACSGGQDRPWFPPLRARLIDRQAGPEEPKAAGSWPGDRAGGDRLVPTCLALLTLECGPGGVAEALVPAKDLLNPDIGLEPDLKTVPGIERIDDITVPPVVGPDVPVGVPEPPGILPPPPGTGAGLGGLPDGGMAGAAALNAFSGRSGSRKIDLVKTGGGNAESEAAVARGLAWLAKQQKENGCWITDGSVRDEIAGTGFALLPFLAAGQSPKARTGGFRDVKPEYAAAVDRGLKYLRGKQKPDGSFSTNAYSNAIATIAVCEAYGMTADPALRAPAQMAIKSIENSQHEAGGWRYQPKQPGDTSVTGWQLQALHSGEMARLTIDKGKKKLVNSFLDSVATDQGATYGYIDKAPRPAMTAVGLLCRYYLGWGPNNPHMAEGVEYLKKTPPGENGYDIYYLYYATQVLHFYGGDDWSKIWNPMMRDLLIKKQQRGDPEGLAGSWGPDQSITGNAGGRLVCTSLSLLTLEVYYRHMPLYKRGTGGLSELEK